MGWLEGKVAIVTGGASGLGRAIVERFVAEGARVAIFDRARDRSEALAAELGAAAIPIIGDGTVMADNQRAVDETVKRFGQLECLVGNAGIWDFSTSLVDLPPDRIGEAFDELFGVNVKGYLLGAKRRIASWQRRMVASSIPSRTRAFIRAAAVRCTPLPSMQSWG